MKLEFIGKLTSPVFRKVGEYLLPALPFVTVALIGLVLLLAWATRDVMPRFERIEDVSERKSAFFNWLLPEVERENQRLTELRGEVLALHEKLQAGESLTRHERKLLTVLAKRYESPVGDPRAPQFFSELLTRIDIIPVSLVLAQAAWESGWGTSRFARKGYNLFGHWCTEPGCGLVPGERQEGAGHEVAVFRDVRESVRKYLRNLNSHRAYREFRARRAMLRNQGRPVTGPALVDTLDDYSERGDAYVRDIERLMLVNDLPVCTRNAEIAC